MRIEPELGGASIVVVGHINPAIFSPLWLSKQGLITDLEAEAATTTLIHPELVQFEFGNMILNANNSQFSLESTQGPWVTLIDLVVRIFGEVLTHTPLFQFGINRNVHFGVEKEAVRNEIGRLLAPLEPWGEFGREIAEADTTHRGGVSHLTMQRMWSTDGFKGKLNVTVEPSVRIGGNAGIYVRVNDHCEMLDRDVDEPTLRMVKFMASRFEDSLRRSESIVDQVMSLRERVS